MMRNNHLLLNRSGPTVNKLKDPGQSDSLGVLGFDVHWKTGGLGLHTLARCWWCASSVESPIAQSLLTSRSG